MFKLLPHHLDKQDHLRRQCGFTSTQIAQLSQLSRDMDQCTVNEYTSGQGIRPHVESTDAFEEVVLSISLLTPVIMDFRHQQHKHIKKSVVLQPRSLLLLHGESRHLWSHGIAHRKYDIIGRSLVERTRRISLTFRKIRPEEQQMKILQERTRVEVDKQIQSKFFFLHLLFLSQNQLKHIASIFFFFFFCMLFTVF
ncbi:hypothetical protein RFI_00879 [Reticulomyxa filosa]|uniref:Fe2OG dioxygenase domain-containing protein n=1 Tax=Reticulomyxa filosa TaxID=46433 RepID=X6PDP8_RETFI|nr:hypothetical protein RFI_00879 [Reticulomyxa filosa]|eukprot:ETO36184.1 hypothetical protein RFI_00879 [Reticulomyxa filosa]